MVPCGKQRVHRTQKTSTVTRSQCSGAALGCGGERRGCAANKSAVTLRGFHVIVDQNLGGNVSRSLFKLRHGSESERGPNLKKGPVSV